eukprot:TRINITY_DN9891_c0_g2_i2.p1 TRINITY_DN9891_c0_g2~~TRINITY_DN9891_c0_g2_i2.p1  ORF type:complete len:234 (-),score=31.98 TRINITY_DN9891_c0_g2_i2:506-1207(-)
MRENKGPSINLKNINFINKVEKYEKSKASKSSSMLSSRVSQGSGLKFLENDYINKRIYMMKNKLLESFKKIEGIPAEDRKTIESEFTKELKGLKLNLASLKQSRNQLYMRSNAIYYQIEEISNELQVLAVFTVERRTCTKQNIHRVEEGGDNEVSVEYGDGEALGEGGENKEGEGAQHKKKERAKGRMGQAEGKHNGDGERARASKSQNQLRQRHAQRVLHQPAAPRDRYKVL